MSLEYNTLYLILCYHVFATHDIILLLFEILAYVHEIQGCMIKEEDNTERIPQALMHFERSKAVLQKHGESIGIARIEALIIEATAEISEDYDVEGLITCTEEKYNETIKERRPSALDTIQVRLDFARALKNYH